MSRTQVLLNHNKVAMQHVILVNTSCYEYRTHCLADSQSCFDGFLLYQSLVLHPFPPKMAIYYDVYGTNI